MTKENFMTALRTANSTWSAVILIGLCGAVLLSSGCGGRRSQQYTEQGETYLLIGNVADAENSFTRAFELDPGNARAKMGLARCLWLQKKTDESFAAYEEALDLDPKLDKAYMEAARIGVNTGNVERAKTIVDRFKVVDPVAGGILEGYVLRETGDAAGAIAVLSKLSTDHPKAADVRVNLASAYRAAGEYAKAENELHTVLNEMDSSSLPARMLLIEVFQAQGKAQDIVNELRSLATAQPGNDNIQLALARSLLTVQSFDEAEGIARPILERTPESPWANFVVGACLIEREQFADAVDCLSAAFGGLPHEPAVARMLAIAQQGGRAEPTPSASEPVETAAVPDQTPQAESWKDLWSEASLQSLLGKRAAFLAQDDSPELLATLVMAAAFTQDAATVRELLSRMPEDSQERRFVEALIEQQPEKVSQVLESWKATTPEQEIILGNARGLFLTLAGSRARALESFTKIMESFPDNGVALYNIAAMYRSVGMPEFADAALRQLIVRHGGNREARQLLFDVMMQAGRNTDARQLAESTYAMFPEDPFSTIMLVRAYRDAGDGELAIDVLRQALARNPSQTVLAVALAEVLLSAAQIDEARDVLNGIGDDTAFSTQVAVLGAFAAAAKGEWDRVLGISQEHAGARYPIPLRLLHVAAILNSSASTSPFEPLMSADGSPISSPATTILLAVYDKLPGEALPDDAALADALEADPANVALFAHAMACRETRLSSLAYALFEELDRRIPAKPRLVNYLLSSLAAAGELSDRAEIATRYTETYPALPAAWLGLADVQRTLKNIEAERSALQKAVEVGADNSEAWLRYARFLDEQSDMQGMLSAYRKLSALLPGDPFIANNLAYCILQTDGDANEALTYATGAFEKAKTSPQILHTLGLAQLRTGDVDEGSRNLRLALEMRPGDPTLLLDAGKALLAQNKEEEGREYITYALHYARKLGLDFPGEQEAEQLLAGG
jgi:tetratricopeptide (TPR) repeat protein